MWKVLESRAAQKTLDGAPANVRRKWDVWVSIVETSGPGGLRQIKGFYDHPLDGKWRGHRSSSLNEDYRVIYLVRREELTVAVVDVNKHDYRKR